ncbi:MarR family winged helix-turn-helix transcriptional regulator [Ruania zhangjianzhongii]|uniref:MarR family winged helix-turn-helix transcriptional regulator n=1 Tax=Ruania zhangjianzhongii TaxID=2603206 RepID=UPI001AEFFB83|nr:MarR family winged helix-turn-helix transcriptional regulator [Ruania zhangjianzhongii]
MTTSVKLVAMGQEWTTAVATLRVAGQLVDGIQRGMRERGYTDLRPAHGFAFIRLSAGPATTVQVAEHLGVTKQAASEMVRNLTAQGYLRRQPDPVDRRQVLLELTAQGQDATAAATAAATETVAAWRDQLPDGDLERLTAALLHLAEPGPLRPAW